MQCVHVHVPQNGLFSRHPQFLRQVVNRTRFVALTLDTQETLGGLKGAQYLPQLAVLLADLSPISCAGNIEKQNNFLSRKPRLRQ
jgi:hypothetical protein